VGYEARLGDGRLLDELEQAIIGKEADSEFDVPVDFPADHPMGQLAGNHATFHLKLREVSRLELPKLTDDIAKQVSEFSTAKELTADIRRSVEERLTGEIDGIFRGNAVAALAKAAELAEPQVLVEQRQQEMYMGMRQQLEQSGITVEAYLDQTGRDMTALFAELEEGARDDLRRELSLLALAEDAAVAVTEDDLRSEIADHAKEIGEDPELAIDRVMHSGRADLLRGELLIQRTIDHLVKSVKAVEVDPPDPESASAGDEPAEAGKGEGSDGDT
jgi:trigger factor